MIARCFRNPVVVTLAIVIASINFGCSHAQHLPPSEHLLTRALKQGDDWFRSSEGRSFADNIVSWQNPNGGWWKKYDPTRPRPKMLPPADTTDAPPYDTESVWRHASTFDNSATYTEMRILARAHRLTDKHEYADAFYRGLQFIFASQYPNGGWPQRFPLQNNYGRHITFNDSAMTGVMFLLQDVTQKKPDFMFVSESHRSRAADAFDRGIDCILNCQIRQDGKLTAWCQQHDEVTLAPAGGRAYELPSITADESEGILKLLMSLKDPDVRLVQAIDSAMDWYARSAIKGQRVVNVTGSRYPNGKDRVVVADPLAPPMWARFYDLDTNVPFFCSRDGVKRWSLDQISWERRNNYSWYGHWGTSVAKEYARWKQRTTTRSSQ